MGVLWESTPGPACQRISAEESFHTIRASTPYCRFCALKLAEGAIGDVNELPEGYTTK